ncbi:hypothetical protein BJ508DRAFT_334083 [Ascobolus immersus RN42]|uniref:Uncharacterized protein n=1 Tax=Ascobolus immersus RN42 TaxID=1160509 RepID=A0A3N4HJE4_ASCIM|nr:hypothetical protein BJ508DRAFT_334083 [Ascobolus immersus RN42]
MADQDPPMNERQVVPNGQLVPALGNNVYRRAAALIYNAYYTDDLDEEAEEFLDQNMLSRAFYVLEFNVGASASSDRYKNKYVYPPPAPPAPAAVDGQPVVVPPAPDPIQALRSAKATLRDGIPFVPIFDFNEWLWERQWSSAGWLATEAGRKVAAGAIQQGTARLAAPGAVQQRQNIGPYQGNQFQFRPEAIGYFDPQFPLEQNEGPLDTGRSGKDMVFRNPIVFLQRAVDYCQTPGVDPAVVKRDLPLLFRGTVAHWCSTMLTPADRKRAMDDPSENLAIWSQLIMGFFAPPPDQAWEEMEKISYRVRDFLDGRQPAEYVAQKVTLCKAAELDDRATMRFIWKGLDPEFQNAMPPLDTYAGPGDIVKTMMRKWETWLKLYSNSRQYRPRDYTASLPRFNGASSSSVNQSFRQYSQREAVPRYSGYVKQEPGKTSSTTGLYKKKAHDTLTIKREGTPARAPNLSPKKPCFLCNSTSHWQATCPKNPAAKKGIFIAEVTGDHEYDVEHAAYVYHTHGLLEEQAETWNEDQHDFFEAMYEDYEDDPVATYFLMTPFEPQEDKATVCYSVEADQAPVKSRFTDCPVIDIVIPQQPSGLGYRGPIKATPDSGSGLSLVDRVLLSRILSILQAADPECVIRTAPNPLPLKGLGDISVPTVEYISFKLFLPGTHAVTGAAFLAAIRVEFYIVDNLNAGLLLGNDVLFPSRATLDYGSSTFNLPVHAFTMPMFVHRPAAMARPLMLKVAREVEIPAASVGTVPFQPVQMRIGTDYLFEPDSQDLPVDALLSSHLINDRSDVVTVTNWSREPIILARNEKLGYAVPLSDE